MSGTSANLHSGGTCFKSQVVNLLTVWKKSIQLH